MGDDITILDDTMQKEQGPVVCTISLGRFTNYGAKMVWDKKGAFLTLPGGRTIKLMMRNNCPHAKPDVVRFFEKLKQREYKKQRVQQLLVKMVAARRAKLKNQQELDDHRRAGHVEFSPDCPECKRGAARKRPHRRLQTRMGGELSVDISGPFMKGLPVTDRKEKDEYWPRWMVVGAFTSYTPKEAFDRHERESQYRISAGLEGPVPLEQTVSQKPRTLYYVEVTATKKSEEVVPAVLRMINRINNVHKVRAVYRLHSDRARELSGEKSRDKFEALGVTVTSTANYDSNANGRAERGVLFFQEKARTLLSTQIRSETFQYQLKKLWTFAAQHAGEIHINDVKGLPA